MVKDNDRSTRESLIASGWTVEGEPETPPRAEPVASEAGDPRTLDKGSASNREIPSGVLVLFGLIGGLYLLYTFVWFSWANAAAQVAAATAEAGIWGALQQVVYWIAPLAPALWFVTVLVLRSGEAVRRTVLWLVLGLVLLVPLPMFGGLFS